MGQIFVRASRRARAHTRRDRVGNLFKKVSLRLENSTKPGGRKLTWGREKQLYSLQKSLRGHFAAETIKARTRKKK